MRTRWILPFAAAAFGYCLAVTLSMSVVALLEGWDGVAASIISLDPDLLPLVLGPAGFHYIAGGIYLLARPRLDLRHADWPRTARVAFAGGALVWWGLIAVIVSLANVTGLSSSPNFMAVTWYASGAICFVAGVVTAESLARAVSSTERVQPLDAGDSEATSE